MYLGTPYTNQQMKQCLKNLNRRKTEFVCKLNKISYFFVLQDFLFNINAESHNVAGTQLQSVERNHFSSCFTALSQFHTRNIVSVPWASVILFEKNSITVRSLLNF